MMSALDLQPSGDLEINPHEQQELEFSPMVHIPKNISAPPAKKNISIRLATESKGHLCSSSSFLNSFQLGLGMAKNFLAIQQPKKGQMQRPKSQKIKWWQ